ncbi:hypothetical protein CRUP_034276 [Coryphaenoides rupestris]|nr:hypothetical protein CRUP_034276 [Coryphaenoides rupestris]
MRRFRFVGGFVCGAAVSTGSCVAVLRLYRAEPEEEPRGPGDTLPAVQEDIGRFGFPDAGAEVRYYANHTLSYNQAKRTPRWVAEHLTREKLLGKTERKHCRFRPDPSIPVLFSAANGDYLRSGWSRGHMAPAGDSKHRFSDVWVVSGPLALPSEEEEEEGGRKTVSYQVIGKDNVAVPTHLFKVVLVLNSVSTTDVNNNVTASAGQTPSPVPALAAFIAPNQPIGFDRKLTDFQVGLPELERVSGLTFFPKLPAGSRATETSSTTTPTTTTTTGLEATPDNKPAGSKPEQGDAAVVAVATATDDLCKVDGCQLMGFKEFTLYLTGRKVGSARSLEKMDKFMAELKEQDIQPDDYLTELYLRRKQELTNQSPPPDTKAGTP